MRVRVCRSDEVPEVGMRGFRVEGVDAPVLVARVDGRVVATASICPHEDVSLLGGVLDGGCVTCPGHAYEFDLVTGDCSHEPRLRLRRYRVHELGGEVWIDLIYEPEGH